MHRISWCLQRARFSLPRIIDGADLLWNSGRLVSLEARVPFSSGIPSWCRRASEPAESCRGRTFRVETVSWDTSRHMPDATISVDAALKARLADLAGQTGQRVDEFVEALLRRIADADVRFERGVPVFPRRPGAPTLSVEDVNRLIDGTDA